MWKEEMNVRFGPQRETSNLQKSGEAKTRKRSRNEHRPKVCAISHQSSTQTVLTLSVSLIPRKKRANSFKFYILNIHFLASTKYRFSLFLYLLSHHIEFLVNNRAVGYSCESPGPSRYPWISTVIWHLLDHTYVN